MIYEFITADHFYVAYFRSFTAIISRIIQVLSYLLSDNLCQPLDHLPSSGEKHSRKWAYSVYDIASIYSLVIPYIQSSPRRGIDSKR